jgi:hypothetical protein
MTTLRQRIEAAGAVLLSPFAAGYAQDIRDELLAALPPDPPCEHAYPRRWAQITGRPAVVVCEDCQQEVRVP